MIRKVILLALLTASVPAAAQLGLPPLGETMGGTLGRVGGVVERGLEPVQGVVRSASQMAQMRIDRLGDFVRRNRDSVEFDEDRQPAKRGEAIVIDPDPASLQAAEAAGYRLAEQAELEGLGLRYARLLLPSPVSRFTSPDLCFTRRSRSSICVFVG